MFVPNQCDAFMKMRKLKTQVEMKSTGPIENRPHNPLNSGLPSIVDDSSPMRIKDISASRYANSLHNTNNKLAIDYGDMYVSKQNDQQRSRGTLSQLRLGQDYSKELINVRRTIHGNDSM